MNAPTATGTGGAAGLGSRFRRILAASGAANVADGVFRIALPLLAAQLTREPVAVAAVTLAQRLPWLLFALVAGALADRLDRRRTMLVVQCARVLAFVALAVLVAAGAATIPALVAFAFALGVTETLYDTAAQSILPAVVPPAALPVANGRLFAVEMTANEFAGPPLGGVLAGIAGIGVALAFGTTAALYAVAAVLLFTIDGDFRAATAPSGGPSPGAAPGRPLAGGLLADIGEGVRYLVRHRLLSVLALMTGVQNVASTAAQAVLVLYATGPGSVLGLSARGFGLLTACFGLGGLAGALAAPWLQRRIGRSNLLVVALVVPTVALATLAVTSSPVVAGVALALDAILVMGWNVVTVSLRQRVTPDRLLGRVNAGYRLVAWGSMPVGAALGGLLGDLAGLRAVFLVAAALVAVLLVLRPQITDGRLAAAEERALVGTG